MFLISLMHQAHVEMVWPRLSQAKHSRHGLVVEFKLCVMLYLAGNITLEFRHIWSVCNNLGMQFSKL